MDNIDFDNRISVAHILKKRWYYKPTIPFWIIAIFVVFYHFAPHGEAFVVYVSQASFKWFSISYSFAIYILLFCIFYVYFQWRFTYNILISGKKKLFFSKFKKRLLERSTKFKINKQELLNLCLKFELKIFFAYFICYSLCLFINLILLEKNARVLFKIWPLFGMIITMIIFFASNSPCVYLSHSYYEARSNQIKKALIFSELEQKAIRNAKMRLKYKLDLAKIQQQDKKL